MKNSTAGRRCSALIVLSDGLLLLLALCGAVWSVMTTYATGGDLKRVLAACVIFAAASLLCFSLPKCRWLALLLLGAAFAAFSWHNRETVVLGARAVWCAAVNAMAEGFSSIGRLELTAGEQALAAASGADTLFLMLAAALLAAALGWMLIRLRASGAVFVVTLALLLPGLLADRMPAWLPFLGLIVCWTVLLLGGLCGRRDPEGGARFHLLALPAAAVLLAVLSAALPRETYRQPDWTAAARQQVQRATNRIPGGELLSRWVSATGGDVSVRLSDAGPCAFSGRTVLRVATDLPGHYYLRGTSAAIYTGSAWLPLNAGESAALWTQARDRMTGAGGYAPLNFPSLTAYRKPYYEMTVTYVDSLWGRLYTPYQMVSAPDEISGAVFTEDTGVERAFGVREKNLFFKPGALPDGEAKPLPQEAAAAESRYREFVYQHYLAVPEGFEQVVQTWVSGISADAQPETPVAIMSGGPYTVRLSQAVWIAGLLNASTKYDLQTPAPDAGQDFVDYFLNDAKRGYCMHYATAGTLLLRYCGIPARYVSGYTVDIGASGRADVPDSNAHAWVEVYLDGYGWYPVDMTPGANGAGPAAVVEQPETKPDTAPKPAAGPDAPKPVAPKDTQPAAPKPTAPPDAPEKTARAARGMRLLLWPGLTLLVGLSLVLRRRLCALLRRRRLAASDANRAVIAAYGCLERLVPWGGEIGETAERLAQKARFSQHVLDDAERDAVLERLREETRRIDASLPRWKRLAFRYLWGLN